jgi:transcriptional regulator with XRE-family HTH domain
VPYTVKTQTKISTLKKERIKKGLSQQQLSEVTGVPIKSIGNYEQLRRDINNAHAIVVFRLASALGCNVSDLLDV